jgi:hypothetical protein
LGFDAQLLPGIVEIDLELNRRLRVLRLRTSTTPASGPSRSTSG